MFTPFSQTSECTLLYQITRADLKIILTILIHRYNFLGRRMTQWAPESGHIYAKRSVIFLRPPSDSILCVENVGKQTVSFKLYLLPLPGHYLASKRQDPTTHRH